MLHLTWDMIQYKWTLIPNDTNDSLCIENFNGNNACEMVME